MEKLRILIVDDDRWMAKTLKDIFKIKGYDADAAHSGTEALEKIQKVHFDCILTDIKMPGMNGIEFCRAVKEIQPEIPVVLTTAYSTNKLVKEGLEEEAVAILTKPLDIKLLLGFFSALKRENSVVIIDDDPEFRKSLGEILREWDFSVTEITAPVSFMKNLEPVGQVVLLDMNLGDISGLDVLKEIRAKHPELPVILMTGYREEMSGFIENCLKISAFTCLYKPFRIEELLKVLNEVHRMRLGAILGRTYTKRIMKNG